MNKDSKDQRDYRGLHILECLSLTGFIFLPYPHLLLPEVDFSFFASQKMSLQISSYGLL